MAKLGPGARVGDQFLLLRKIGEGGCGEVYLAEQTTLSRNVVVKLMHPELSRDSSYVARFRREAQLAARLTHHHTAAIYAFGETPDHVLWIAMEYIEGQSLHDMLARETPRQVGELLTPVADVLDRAGALGIIHRDVKPDNIIVAPDGPGRRAVLLDFGLARPMEDNDKLTAVGVAVGSPTYMSPEQVFGPAVDSATDRYALGIILYIAVARRPPFRHDDRVQLVLMHKRQPVPALSSLVPAIAQGHPLDQFFTRALAKKPEDRYPSARQMLAEFLAALEQAPLDRERAAEREPAPAPAPTGERPPSGPAPGPKSTGGQRATPPPPLPIAGAAALRSRPPDVLKAPAPHLRSTVASPAIARGASQAPAPPVEPARPVTPATAPEPAPAELEPDPPSDPTMRIAAATAPAAAAQAQAQAMIAEVLPGHKRLQVQVATQPAAAARRLDVLCGNEAILGKHRDCDLVCRAFPTPEQDAITHGVSRQHAKLRVSGGKLTIEDLSSLNGTYLDDKRLSGGPVPLYDEAQVRLGPVLTLEVRLFKKGAALLRRVDPYHGDYPPTLLVWDRVDLGEPAAGLIPATGDSVTRWGTLQHNRQKSGSELWWNGPSIVSWQRGGKTVQRPGALQPDDRMLMGSTTVEWDSGPKPGLG